MSRGIYIGLASLLFLALIGGLALFNTWQIANLEERLIKTQQGVMGLKQDLGALNNVIRRSRPMAGGALPMPDTNPNEGTPAPQDLSCPGNLLVAPPQRLPDDASYGGTLRRTIVTSSKGFNVFVEPGADVTEYYRYVGGQFANYHPENPDYWIPDLAWCITAEDKPLDEVEIATPGDTDLVAERKVSLRDFKNANAAAVAAGKTPATAKDLLFTEYHIKLYQDVFWHPVQPEYLDRSPWLQGEHRLTADDFVFAYEVIMNPKIEGAARLRTYFKDIERLEPINDHELKIVWKTKTHQSFDFTMSFSPLPRWVYGFDPDGNPYPSETFAQSFTQHWYRHIMGTGPYRFDSFEHNSFVRLTKNPDYLHGELPAFDEIIYYVVSNADQQLAKLRAGEVDFIELQPSQYRKEIAQNGDSDFTRELTPNGRPVEGKMGYDIYPRMAYRYIAWNAAKPMFADKRVRRALTQALNRDAILRDIFQGLGVVTSGIFYPESPEYDHSIKAWPYDLDRAAQLLEEAGWTDTNSNGIRDKDGEEFRFTLQVYGYRAEYIALAEYYKEDLKKIGIDMTILPLDWSALQKKMNDRDYDGFTGGWGLAWRSDPYQIWHSSGASEPESSNRVNFRNPRADEIIETARRTFDNEARTKLFHEFHAIMHEEQPYTFLFAERTVGAWQKQMRNMVFQMVRPHDSSLPWFKELH